MRYTFVIRVVFVGLVNRDYPCSCLFILTELCEGHYLVHHNRTKQFKCENCDSLFGWKREYEYLRKSIRPRQVPILQYQYRNSDLTEPQFLVSF